jgi:hypothetical protein
MKLGEVVWKVNDSVTYTISGVQHKLQYLDTAQRSRINANHTVDIYGGKLFVGMAFQWQRRGHGMA